mmetsp:Transcript_1356/g.1424  ORF Transcript_1356/g.1424 Transcript_1356/m.1424 type:complete len:327 (+) Transcript_1356:2-982(+)
METDEVWHSSTSTWFRKVGKVTGVYVHSGRDTTMCNIEEGELSVELCRRLYSKKREFKIVGPLSLTLKLCACYQKGTQLFSPVRVRGSVRGREREREGGVEIVLTDEQIAFILKVTSLLWFQVSSLQKRTRAMLSGSCNISVRARMRWRMIKEKVKAEWWRWTGQLQEGVLRWRSWFETWRTAARYVALREILMYHVGFGMHSDGSGDHTVHALFESLFEDHPDPTSELASITCKQIYAKYYTRADFSRKLIRAAETLIEQRLGRAKNNQVEVDPMCLSPMAVRALYSLQLELDAVLTPRIIAYCRLWAEERYRLRGGEREKERDE